ncbi:hypothetical protein V1524DRAFT_427221 [Lipomyces starkeyi]
MKACNTSALSTAEACRYTSEHPQHRKLFMKKDNILKSAVSAKISISLPTITAYLHNWLFSIGRHSKEVILMVMSEDISAVGNVRPENDCM